MDGQQTDRQTNRQLDSLSSLTHSLQLTQSVFSHQQRTNGWATVSQSHSLTLTHSHSLTHSLTVTESAKPTTARHPPATFTHSLTHSLTHTHSHSLSTPHHSRSLTHTRSLTHSHSLTHSLTHTHSHSLTLVTLLYSIFNRTTYYAIEYLVPLFLYTGRLVRATCYCPHSTHTSYPLKSLSLAQAHLPG